MTIDPTKKYIFLGNDNGTIRSGDVFTVEKVKEQDFFYNERVGYLHPNDGLSFIELEQSYNTDKLMNYGLSTIELRDGRWDLNQYEVRGYPDRVGRALRAHSGFQSQDIARRTIEKIESLLQEAFLDDIEYQKIDKLKN